MLNGLSTNFILNTYCYTHRFVQLSVPPREGLFAVVSSSYEDSQLVKAQRISECGVPVPESDFCVTHTRLVVHHRIECREMIRTVDSERLL